MDSQFRTRRLVRPASRRIQTPKRGILQKVGNHPASAAISWSPTSLLSAWVQQGMDYYSAGRQILIDTLTGRNSSLMKEVQKHSSTRTAGNEGITALAGEAIGNLIRAHNEFLELAQRQNEIISAGMIERIGNPRAVAGVDLLRRGVDILLGLQRDFLASAAHQTDAWLQASASRKPDLADALAELARKGMRALVHSQKMLLDAILEAATSTNNPIRKGNTPDNAAPARLAYQSANASIDAQKILLDLAGCQLRLALKAAQQAGVFTLPLDAISLILAVEILLLHAAPVYYGIGVPRGDNSGVVLIPGFMGTDLHLVEMSGWLRRIGYRPYLSGIGLNADCPNLLIRDQLKHLVSRARRETKGKIHLIGHSLGGMIARSLAAQMPDDIASVTTLGSPIRNAVVHSKLLRAAEIVRRHILTVRGPDVLEDCYTGHCSCNFVASLRRNPPPSILQTAIYTRTDEVLDWRCCTAEDRRQNFEVPGTHLGMPFNPAAYRIVASRLAGARRHLRRPARAARQKTLRHTLRLAQA